MGVVQCQHCQHNWSLLLKRSIRKKILVSDRLDSLNLIPQRFWELKIDSESWLLSRWYILQCLIWSLRIPMKTLLYEHICSQWRACYIHTLSQTLTVAWRRKITSFQLQRCLSRSFFFSSIVHVHCISAFLSHPFFFLYPFVACNFSLSNGFH